MLKEIYLRDSSDPYYSENVLEHSSELENLLGQIRMILYTKKGDVMGSYDFGYNLEEKLFLLDVDENELKSQLTTDIYQYCPDASNFNVEVKTQFFQGTVRDICLLDIYIDSRKTLGILVT